MNKNTLIPVGLGVLIMVSTSYAQTEPEKNVKAYSCDDCNYSEAENLVKEKVPPSVECHSKPSSSDNSTDTRVCYSTPVYAAVLNESSGKVWGIKLSHSHQGERPELMELQTSPYEHPQFVNDAIRSGYEYTDSLIAHTEKIANNISRTFETSKEFNDWIDGKAEPETNERADSNQLDDTLCAHDNSQYQAVKALTSGEFESNLQATVNEQFANFSGTSQDFFDDLDFSSLSSRLEELDYNFTLSSSDKNNTKNVSFEFSGSKDFPSKNPPSKLTYTLIPKQSHIDVSLNPSLTHIGGYYWSVLAKPEVNKAELPPCTQVALKDHHLMN